MIFLLQKENEFDMDVLIFKNILDKVKYFHEYETISLSYLEDNESSNYPIWYKDAIPVGSIQFINRWLSLFQGIEHIYPIEIPTCLRNDKFLKRKYSIRKKDDIPDKGFFFIKDSSQLKVFSYCGELRYFFYPETQDKPTSEFDNPLRLNPNHLYQVSEVVNILSEYRVYIIDGNIEAISHYNGDATLFPDVNLIKEANLLYSRQSDYPKSYSMDVMVTPQGTAIIEIHNFHSLGLYTTLFGDNLAYAYRDGIDYIIKHNTPQSIYSNFEVL